MGLLKGKFCQFLTELSARSVSLFLFQDDNYSKYQWISTKLSVCIDIVDIWLGFDDGLISSIFDRVICPRHIHIFISGRLF